MYVCVYVCMYVWSPLLNVKGLFKGTLMDRNLTPHNVLFLMEDLHLQDMLIMNSSKKTTTLLQKNGRRKDKRLMLHLL